MIAALDKVTESAITVDRAKNVLQALYSHIHAEHNGDQDTVAMDTIETVRELLERVRDGLDAAEIELREENRTRQASAPPASSKKHCAPTVANRKAVRRG